MNQQIVKQNNYLFACDVPVAESQRSCLQILYALDLQLWLVTDDTLKSVTVKVACDWFPFFFFSPVNLVMEKLPQCKDSGGVQKARGQRFR